MSYEFYKTLHIIGIAWMFATFGAQTLHGLSGASKEDHPAYKLIGRSFIASILLVFVAGFGMQAKLKIGFPGWFLGKILVWVAICGLVTLPLRRPDLSKPIWLSIPVLAGIAAWLVVYKPF